MVVGVLIIAILNSGMNFLNLNQYWQYVVLGVVLLAAVTMDTLQTRAAANAAKKVTGNPPVEEKDRHKSKFPAALGREFFRLWETQWKIWLYKTAAVVGDDGLAGDAPGQIARQKQHDVRLILSGGEGNGHIHYAVR